MILEILRAVGSNPTAPVKRKDPHMSAGLFFLLRDSQIRTKTCGAFSNFEDKNNLA
jgi:hypothetical protein